MRLHRINKDGTCYYYCYFKNRASAMCQAAYRFNQYTKTVHIVTDHNHEPNQELNKVELMKFRQKEMAKERPDLNPKEIVKETCREFNTDFKKALGNYDAQRKRIQRAKAYQQKMAQQNGNL